MIIVLQVILLIIIVISFIGVFAENNKELQEKMLVMLLGSLSAFIMSALWL